MDQESYDILHQTIREGRTVERGGRTAYDEEGLRLIAKAEGFTPGEEPKPKKGGNKPAVQTPTTVPPPPADPRIAGSTGAPGGGQIPEGEGAPVVITDTEDGKPVVSATVEGQGLPPEGDAPGIALAELTVAELKERAKALGIDPIPQKKAELLEAVAQQEAAL